MHFTPSHAAGLRIPHRIQRNIGYPLAGDITTKFIQYLAKF
jgi:hypothetical protein